MPRLAYHQRTKIIEFWHLEKSSLKVQWQYCVHFSLHLRNAPRRATILKIVPNFSTEGSVHDQNRATVVGGRPVVLGTMWILKEMQLLEVQKNLCADFQLRQTFLEHQFTLF